MLSVKESFKINIYAYLIEDMQTMIKIAAKKGPLFAITAESQKRIAKPIKMQETREAEGKELEYTYNLDIFDICSGGVELANINFELSVN